MAKQEGALGGEARLGWEDAKLRPSPQAMVLQDIFDAQYGAHDLQYVMKQRFF
ncbi:MAG: hypothetical protein ABJV68_01210 [Paracoccaceae bacterium]